MNSICDKIVFFSVFTNPLFLMVPSGHRIYKLTALKIIEIQNGKLSVVKKQ